MSAYEDLGLTEDHITKTHAEALYGSHRLDFLRDVIEGAKKIAEQYGNFRIHTAIAIESIEEGLRSFARATELEEDGLYIVATVPQADGSTKPYQISRDRQLGHESINNALVAFKAIFADKVQGLEEAVEKVRDVLLEPVTQSHSVKILAERVAKAGQENVLG